MIVNANGRGSSAVVSRRDIHCSELVTGQCAAVDAITVAMAEEEKSLLEEESGESRVGYWGCSKPASILCTKFEK